MAVSPACVTVYCKEISSKAVDYGDNRRKIFHQSIVHFSEIALHLLLCDILLSVSLALHLTLLRGS